MQKGWEKFIIWSYIIAKQNTFRAFLKGSLKCIVGSLAAEPKVPRKGHGGRRRLSQMYVNNRAFIVQKRGKTGKPSGVLTEQSTADPAVLHSQPARNNLYSISEGWQRKHRWKRSNAGIRLPTCDGRCPPGEGAGSRQTPTARTQQTPPSGAGTAGALTESPNTTNPTKRCEARLEPSPRARTQQTPPSDAIRKGEAPAEHPARPGPSPRRDWRPAPPRRYPSPWLTRRKAWVKDGSSESFSAISSGRYFSSMAAAARGGSGTAAPAGKERVRVPGGGKSSEAALPPGRLPPGAAGTHPGGSAASPRPGAGRERARAGGTPPLSGQGARTKHSEEAQEEVRRKKTRPGSR